MVRFLVASLLAKIKIEEEEVGVDWCFRLRRKGVKYHKELKNKLASVWNGLIKRHPQNVSLTKAEKRKKTETQKNIRNNFDKKYNNNIKYVGDKFKSAFEILCFFFLFLAETEKHAGFSLHSPQKENSMLIRKWIEKPCSLLSSFHLSDSFSAIQRQTQKTRCWLH